MAWEKVKTSKDPDRLIEFIDLYPISPNRRTALMLVRTLSVQGAATSSKPEIAELRASRIGAFFRGMIFQVPQFQLQHLGIWSSIGFSISFLVLGFVGFMLAVEVGRIFDSLTCGPSAGSAAIASVLLVIPVFGLRQLNKWAAQRLFLAASIATVVNAIYAFIAVLIAEQAMMSGPGLPVVAVVGAVVSSASVVLYSIWTMWRAR